MSSNLRVNNILPSVGTNVAIGTAGGSITLTGGVTGSNLTLTGGINATGVLTATTFSGNLTGAVNSSGIATFSSGIVVAAGSTAAPSISPSGDSNTGIFFPSADTIAFGEGGSEAVRIDSSGRLGIGTNNMGSNTKLHIKNSAADDYVRVEHESNDTQLRIQVSSTQSRVQLSATYNSTGSYYPLAFLTSDTERARIDTSGRLLIGTTSARTDIPGGNQGLLIEGTSTTNSQNRFTTHVFGSSDSQGPYLGLGKTRSTSLGGNTVVQSGDEFGGIYFHGSDGSTLRQGAYILGSCDGTPGAADMPGRLVFATTRDGASSPTEALRITNAGSVRATTDQNVSGIYSNPTNGSYTGAALQAVTTRAGNAAFWFLLCESNNTADVEFALKGDGNALADGTWTGGGADYAEYFEWSDSNHDEEDRRGISVVLDGNKIREAVTGEDPIGVISGNPSVVGDAAWNKWSGKYLRDEFGSYLLDENGDRQLNPAYDPDAEYIPREQRPEWDCVGLMGKLRIRKGQVTGSRWIKMRDISDTVEEWLVR